LLRDSIAKWTLGDFEADPTLSGAMAALDPARRDVLSMLHARSWLFAASRIIPRDGKPIDDWRGTVSEMLARSVPLAMRRLLSNAVSAHYAPQSYALPAEGYAALGLDVDDDTAMVLRHVVHPASRIPGIPFVRDAAPFVIRDRERSYSSRTSTRLVLPVDPSRVDDAGLEEEWLDAYDAFIVPPRWNAGQNAISLEPIKEAREAWNSADESLSSSWLALAASIDQAAAIRGSDGTVLMSLGGGLVARLEVTETATDTGALRAMVDEDAHGNGTVIVPAGVTGISYTVPRGLVLLSGRSRAAISFAASPLLIGQGNGGGMSMSLRAAVVERDAEDERNSYDD
jgi:hypothetical protein